MLTIDNVYRASHALKGVARKTDVLYAPKLCPGTDLYLKTENLQITGSFKVRGSAFKISIHSASESFCLILISSLNMISPLHSLPFPVLFHR